MVNENLATQLVKNGHQVKFVVGNFQSGLKKERIRGYEVNRVGNKYTVYIKAFLYYKKHLNNWPDLIIEEINTIPFMTQWYSKTKRLLFIHQLCRQIWFYQFPFLLGSVGYFLEPLYLKLLSKNRVVTVSKSSKSDLIKYGFNRSKVGVITQGIDLKPISKNQLSKQNSPFVLLSLGTIRSMKRTHHQVLAFEKAKSKIPNLRLIIAGKANSAYGQRVLSQIRNSRYKSSIQYLGPINEKAKTKLLRQAHLLLNTSVKEGWGLTVTEAASQGTPSVAYNVDGLRDSVSNNQANLLTPKPNPEDLARLICKLYNNPKLYQQIQLSVWKSSLKNTSKLSYRDYYKQISQSN